MTDSDLPLIFHHNEYDDYSGPDYHHSLEEAEACSFGRGRKPIVVISAKAFSWLLSHIGGEHGMTQLQVWDWACEADEG